MCEQSHKANAETNKAVDAVHYAIEAAIKATPYYDPEKGIDAKIILWALGPFISMAISEQEPRKRMEMFQWFVAAIADTGGIGEELRATLDTQHEEATLN